jgi:predicted naringenin-chalcone synthase
MTSSLELMRSATRGRRTSQVAGATLAGVGVATPALSVTQAETARRLARIWRLRGGELQRWRRMIRGSMIERRHAVLPPEDIVDLTTRQRMELFERLAPDLAAAAASRAIEHAAIDARSITDIIVVTCTGFSAPGIDVEVVERLGLDRGVHRTIIGFMGCFGGLIGLRTGAAACVARPRGAALVICVELCSLHIRRESDPQNLVASALFADGAAAAVIVGEHHESRSLRGRTNVITGNSLARVTSGRSVLLPEGRRWMSWRITDAGFAMTLARQIPEALRANVRVVLDSDSNSSTSKQLRDFIVHPGGSAILDAVEDGLELDPHQLDSARTVLRQFGNMSSSTVLFVLLEHLRRGLALPATMIAFGPGLSIETIGLGRCGDTPGGAAP